MLKEDLLNIVALIVRHMSEEGHEGLRGKTILDGLLDEGYDPVDIDDALSWFETLAGAGEELGGVELWHGFKGFRVQTHPERDALTPDAFRYLSKLNKAGIIDDGLREAILDKVLELSIPSFGMDQLKALLGLVLYARGGASSKEVFYLLEEHGENTLNN